ncbi:MAG: hypothetical protein Q3Y08_07325, partial [Butyricicoccus sp.]|nr:hypothetical protein [Butyricicoccus sp.]
KSVCDPSNGPMVRQRARREARQKAAAIRTDAVQQLRTLLQESGAYPTVQQAVLAQLNRLEQSEILAAEGGVAPDGQQSMHSKHNHQGTA